MSKLIVIDRGLQHIRLLEADTRGSRVVVRKLTTLTLPDGHETGESDVAKTLVEKELQGYAGSGAKIIGLIGRSQAVLRDLRLPTGPPEEMPGMIQLQAMRELSFPVEQAAIDYELVGPPDEEGQQRVILAALQQEVIERYHRVVRSSHLELIRLGLRPYATWRAYRQIAVAATGAVLVISLAGESLELTVARGESVLFSRATLLRSANDGKTEAGDSATALVAEVRRTLAAFANQMPGVPVERIALAASRDEHRDLSDALAAAGLSVAIDRFDPFQMVELGREVAQSADGSKDNRGAFVAAIGAAISVDESWPIDFLNTKKPIVRRDRRKPLAMIAAAAAVLVVAAGYLFAHVQISSGKEKINRLTQQQNDLKDKLASINKIVSKYRAVEKWSKAEVNALEELRRLTDEFPDSKDMFATLVQIMPDRSLGGSGKITLDGVARKQVTISQFNNKLNGNDHYSAQPVGQVVPEKKTGEYRWSYKTHITLKSDVDEDAAKLETGWPADRDSDGSIARRSPAGTREASVIPASEKRTGTPVRNRGKKGN